MTDHVSHILQQWLKHKPELDCSPMGILGRVDRMSKFASTLVDQTIFQFDLSRIEFDILATLRRSDTALTPTQLYQDTLLSSGAMSTKLELLVKKGWLVRRPSPNDRRSCTVELSELGREKIDTVLTHHVENEHRILDCFSEKEQKQMANLLAKWLAHYEHQSRHE